jgi:hypothetical protein
MEPDIAKAFLRTIQQIKDATAISRIEYGDRQRCPRARKNRNGTA